MDNLLTQEIKEISKAEVSNLAHVVCHLSCVDEDGSEGYVAEYVAEYKKFFRSLGVDEKVIRHIVLKGIIRGLNEYRALRDSNSSIVELLKASKSNDAHAASSMKPSASPNIASNAEDLSYICKDLRTVLAEVAVSKE